MVWTRLFQMLDHRDHDIATCSVAGCEALAAADLVLDSTPPPLQSAVRPISPLHAKQAVQIHDSSWDSSA